MFNGDSSFWSRVSPLDKATLAPFTSSSRLPSAVNLIELSALYCIKRPRSSLAESNSSEEKFFTPGLSVSRASIFCWASLRTFNSRCARVSSLLASWARLRFCWTSRDSRLINISSLTDAASAIFDSSSAASFLSARRSLLLSEINLPEVPLAVAGLPVGVHHSKYASSAFSASDSSLESSSSVTARLR